MLSATLLDTMISMPCSTQRPTSPPLVLSKEDLEHVPENSPTTRLRDISMRIQISRDSLDLRVHLLWSRHANTGHRLATRTKFLLHQLSTRRTSHSSVPLVQLRLATAQVPHGLVLPLAQTTRPKLNHSKK